ncbi:MAG: hypothetical protein PHZ09_01830 [Eubacteriales bacterium]|nr:hypothetical protein [Eubacteriales bacterium]
MVINEDCMVKFVFRDGTELPWTTDPGVKAYKKRKTAESCRSNMGEFRHISFTMHILY